MSNFSDAAARRPIILYIIVAIVLVVGLLVGLRWAKIRSDDYAAQVVGQIDQASQPQDSSDPIASQQDHEQSPTQASESTPESTSPANNESASVSRVPAAGIEEGILPIVVLGAVVYAGFSYVLAKRRLRAYALNA